MTVTTRKCTVANSTTLNFLQVGYSGKKRKEGAQGAGSFDKRSQESNASTGGKEGSKKSLPFVKAKWKLG